MKIARLVDPQFQLALNKLASADLPIKTAWKLKSIVKKVQEEYGKYEEVRKDLLNKHGKKNEEGTLALGNKGEVQFEGDGVIEFQKAYAELANLDAEISTISISELGHNLSLSFTDLEMLDGLVVE